jgi:hypothetical protein
VQRSFEENEQKQEKAEPVLFYPRRDSNRAPICQEWKICCTRAACGMISCKWRAFRVKKSIKSVQRILKIRNEIKNMQLKIQSYLQKLRLRFQHAGTVYIHHLT